MKNKVSVVITTRNRHKDLSHCIASLVSQSQKLDELVIIDNNSSDNTKQVIYNIKGNVSFPIRYVNYKKVGYPHVYNQGLSKSSGDWVAFIDDDCIAELNWYKRIKFITRKIDGVSAILGYSEEYNSKFIPALVKYYIDQTGLIGAIEKKYLINDLEILDSKNIIFNKKFLKDNNIKFDVSLLNYGNGASEDCDMGMQIYHAGGRAIFDKKIRVSHKDPINYSSYYSKILFTLKNHLVYEEKWRKVRSGISTKRQFVEKIKIAKEIINRYNMNIFKSFLFIFNIAVSYIYIKILRIYLGKKIMMMDIKRK